MKRSRIEAKGLPSFHLWRFITLTLDPKRDEFCGSPLVAFLKARSRMRGFLQKCREAGLWSENAKWCWKLEFHQNEWPHWHLLVDRKRIFSEDEMRKITELWGMGHTQCECVKERKGEAFRYDFKYAFKPSLAVSLDSLDEDPICCPSWFLDHFQPAGVDSKGRATKPVSFTRVRFWQTSKGFYTGIKPQRTTPKPPVSSIMPEPARQQFERQINSVTVIARRNTGRYVASAVVALTCCFNVLLHRACWAQVHGDGLVMHSRGVVIPVHEVIQKANTNKVKLWQMTQSNRLTLRKASHLLNQGQTLQRC